MSLRFRLGPFTFGRTGVRFSTWNRGTGVSVPLTNRKKARSFGKIKLGPLSYFFRDKSNKNKSRRDIPEQVQRTRKTHKQAYEPWTKELDEQLVALFRKGKTVQELSAIFGRTNGAIRSRINKLLLE